MISVIFFDNIIVNSSAPFTQLIRGEDIPEKNPMDVELYLFQLDTEQDMELREKEIEEHEAKILEIGKGFRAESSALAIVRLMEGIKPFLKRLTKEKAKVLMGKLVDLHLDILVSFTQDER